MNAPVRSFPPGLTSLASAWLIHLADPLGRAPEPAEPLPRAETDAIAAAAAVHGVSPAVLSGLAAEGVEPLALAPWRTQLAYAAGLVLRLRHIGAQCLAELQATALGAVIVKGEVFARRLYPEAALRGYANVDILIRPWDRPVGAKVLAEMGFVACAADDPRVDCVEQKWLLDGRPEIIVALHTDLVRSARLRRWMRLDYDALLAAGDGAAEDPTALLLEAAVPAAASHEFDRLQHLVDVLQLARGAAGPVDPERLRRGAQRAGASFAVAAALGIAGRTFAEPLCLELAAALNAHHAAAIAGRLVSPAMVVRAQGPRRSADSWRRKLLFEAVHSVREAPA